MKLNWKRYNNFFELYDELYKVPQLIYVIGETHHCYIGSVGGRTGQNGLSMRYQKQYIDRSKSIFGTDLPTNQPAFAAIINDQKIDKDDIEPIEWQLQELFLTYSGASNALFTRKGEAGTFNISHLGEPPSFLNSKKINAKQKDARII